MVFFNLRKYGEGILNVLFEIIRFNVGEMWFNKIDSHELDTKKNMLCFDEIRLALLKRLPDNVQRVMLLFLNLFLKFKDMRNTFFVNKLNKM